MGLSRMRCSLIRAALLLLCAGRAWAHKPILADGAAGNAAQAVHVEDVDISMVAYHRSTAKSPRVWIAFDGKKGQQVELQLGVPKLDRFKDIRPAAAVIGPGLPKWKGGFAVPPGLGGVVFGTAAGSRAKSISRTIHRHRLLAV